MSITSAGIEDVKKSMEALRVEFAQAIQVGQKDSDRQKFLLEEYKCLRAETIQGIQANQAVEKDVVLASLAVFSILFATKGINAEIFKTPLIPMLGLLPAVFAFLGWHRTSATTKSLLRIGEYIAKIEEELLLSKGTGAAVGWEHYMIEFRKNIQNGTAPQSAFEFYQMRFWLGQLFVDISVWVGLLYTQRH